MLFRSVLRAALLLVAKAEKEFAESGSDQNTVLKKQTLYRPQMPAENWNYWRFQGEFWRDELGSYRQVVHSRCLDR